MQPSYGPPVTQLLLMQRFPGNSSSHFPSLASAAVPVTTATSAPGADEILLEVVIADKFQKTRGESEFQFTRPGKEQTDRFHPRSITSQMASLQVCTSCVSFPSLCAFISFIGSSCILRARWLLLYTYAGTKQARPHAPAFAAGSHALCVEYAKLPGRDQAHQPCAQHRKRHPRTAPDIPDLSHSSAYGHGHSGGN